MIIPAVIPKSLAQLQNDTTTLSFQDNLQVDVVDGRLTPFSSWPYEPTGEVSEAKKILEPFSFEVDLMVEDPLPAARDWIASGARRLVFHLETLKDPSEAISLAKENSVEVGLALGNDTPLEALYPHIAKVDFIQLMGIARIGVQGEPFDERVLERVAILHTRYPELIVSVDGGVRQKNIANLKQAGASRFVVGSEILEEQDREAEYRKLESLIAT